jgi:hypothetical protein
MQTLKALAKNASGPSELVLEENFLSRIKSCFEVFWRNDYEFATLTFCF